MRIWLTLDIVHCTLTETYHSSVPALGVNQPENDQLTTYYCLHSDFIYIHNW